MLMTAASSPIPSDPVSVPGWLAVVIVIALPLAPVLAQAVPAWIGGRRDKRQWQGDERRNQQNVYHAFLNAFANAIPAWGAFSIERVKAGDPDAVSAGRSLDALQQQQVWTAGGIRLFGTEAVVEALAEFDHAVRQYDGALALFFRNHAGEPDVRKRVALAHDDAAKSINYGYVEYAAAELISKMRNDIRWHPGTGQLRRIARVGREKKIDI